MRTTRVSRWMQFAEHVPLNARRAAILAFVWSLLLCVVSRQTTVFSLLMLGSGVCAAAYGAMFLHSRKDRRGAWMMPVFAVVSAAHMFWVLPTASIVASVIEFVQYLYTTGGRRQHLLPVSLVTSTGLVYFLMIAMVNARLWTLIPMLMGTAISIAILAIGGAKLFDTQLFGVSIAALHLGIAGSLLAGVLEVRARTARIESGHCIACGYDASSVPPGPCPECGKNRDGMTSKKSR